MTIRWTRRAAGLGLGAGLLASAAQVGSAQAATPKAKALRTQAKAERAPAQAEALVYANPLASQEDLAGSVLEGQAAISFAQGRMRLENALDPGLGQQANFVLWLPVELPDDVRISWRFRPLREPGLAMLFFAARAQNGQDIFAPGLRARGGVYDDYIRGDIRALHVSYFRRKEASERALHVANLRKTPGFHLVAQGADPLPAPSDAKAEGYRIVLEKSGAKVAFSIDGLPVFNWTDSGRNNGADTGPVLGAGAIGFRQLAPLAAEYWDLQVHRLPTRD